MVPDHLADRCVPDGLRTAELPGILFAASLWLSNLAYTMLSVAFIQVRLRWPYSAERGR